MKLRHPLEKCISFLLAALIVVQCAWFVMPTASAAEEETSGTESVVCDVCGDKPCICEQEEGCLYCEYTLAEDGTVIHSEGCNADYVYDGTADLEKYVQLSDMAIEYGIDVSGDPANETSLLFYSYEFGENTVMQITGWYWDPGTSGLWYSVELYSGAFPEGTEDYAWPETPWILQTYTNDIEGFGYSLDFVEIEDPDEPEIPSVDATVTDGEGNELTDSEGNPITITVSGEALPDGAEVVATVPTVNGELLEGVYDIKVLVDGVEWQPIDEGKNVTVTIPVDTDKECTGMLHFIDCADAIDGDEMIISTEDLPAGMQALLQPAIDAYGDGINVAVELLSVVQVENGVAVFETDSFSVYTPEYEDQGENFTVTFTSADGTSDPANEKTYYVTVDQVVLFTFDYDAGSVIYDKDQDGVFSLTRLSDNETIDIGETTENRYKVETGSTWYGTTYDYRITESITVTFSEEALGIDLQPGDVFQLDWEKTSFFGSKNPRWTRIMIIGEYSTTFYANGGSFSDGSTELSKTIVSYEPVSRVEEPTRPGYIFTGWCTVQDSTAGGGTVYTSADSFPATLPDDLKLYAQWEPMQYTVTYVVLDEATNKDQFTDQIKYHDIDLLLNQNIPVVDEDTIFKGWDIDNDGDVDISPEQCEAGYMYDGNADLTLVGIWDADVYSIIYNANGGTDAPSPQYVDTSVIAGPPYYIDLSSGVPARPGCIFTGWNTDANGGGTAYASGTKNVEIEGNLTLYAQWSAITYTIKFDGNTNTNTSVTMSNMSGLLYDTSYANLTANAYEKTDYTFQGWSLTEGGLVQYANGENVKVSDLVDAAVVAGQTGDTITLYAVWAKSTYKIIYQAADGDTGVSITNLSQTVIYEVAGDTTINSSASRNRYTFAGWEDEDGNIYLNGARVPIPSSGENGATLTLTATWKMNIVGYICYMNGSTPVLSGTVSVDGDGYNPSAYISIQASSGEAIPDMVFTPADGYEITRIIIEEEEQSDVSSMLEKNGTYIHRGFTATAPYYVAVITEKIPAYTVTWQNYDGTVLETDENVTEGTVPTYDGETPIKAADTQYTYTFSGWTPEVSAVTGNITYTAAYTEEVREYTITWANYDGSPLKTETLEYGTTPVWIGANPTYSTTENGYTWTGWTPVITSVSGNAEYTAVYTVWSTITWENWNGDVLETDEQVENGVKPEYNGETPTRASDDDSVYTFIGWSPSVEEATKHVTYTAIYEAAPHTISVTIEWGSLVFVYDQGDWNPQTHTYIAGTETFTPETFTPETDTASSNRITVTNSTDSTIAVNVSIAYASVYNSISGSFTVSPASDGAAPPEKTELAIGASEKYWLWLTGSLDEPPADGVVGTVTVTIE